MFFSVIRSHGGFNNNPTVKQFKSAFKKLIIHTEVSESSTGNCIPLEKISILNVSSEKKAFDVINNSSSSLHQWTDILHTDDNHDYVENIYYVTEFSINTIVYISGFIVRKIQRTVRCTECLRVLLTTSKEITYHALIRHKTRGYLLHPSADVTFICRSTEKAIRTQLKNYGKLPTNRYQSKAIENEIIQEFIGTNIFEQLNDHVKNQEPLENHRTYLIRLIVKTYIKIRICHFLKESNIKRTERQYYNKLTLFKGQ